jgi:two-component system phosphate regulon response regulator PhoB
LAEGWFGEDHLGTTTPLRASILVGTDDVDFYLLFGRILESEGFGPVLAGELDELFHLVGEKQPSAIILNCQPQSFPNAKVCSRLKQDSRTSFIPVIALVSRGAERDDVRLLQTGVDASFSRPFIPAKLLEHLRAMFGAERAVLKEESVTYADIEMDMAMYRVRRSDRDIHLSPTEFRLLRYLIQHPGQVMTRDQLRNAAWQANVHVGPRTVEVHVGRLRKALNSVSETDLIRTVRSVGYALSDKGLDDLTSEKS